MHRRACLALALILLPAGSAQAQARRSLTLVNAATLSAAETVVGPVVSLPAGVISLAVEAKFVRIGGGTTTKAYVQTSLDNGATWIDVACFAFATTTASKVSAVRQYVALAAAYVPTDGSLTDDTIKDGLIGDRIRVKYVVAGTYTGASSITVSAVAN